MLPCPIYTIVHVYCPGCGVTRMLGALLKGNFYQAFRYNPLVFMLLPFIIFYIVDLIHSKITKKELYTNRVNNKDFYVLIVILLIYGLLRNIDGFEVLRPTKM